jgi:hypothetical protein
MGVVGRRILLRAIRRRGDNVLDLCNCYKVSWANWRDFEHLPFGLPERWPTGYNDASTADCWRC